MTAGMLGREIDLNCGAAHLTLPHLFPRCTLRSLFMVSPPARSRPTTIGMTQYRSNRCSVTKHNSIRSPSVNERKKPVVEINTEWEGG
jgi:hypothetical protein